MRLVLFDVDGTLLDSDAVIHECMRRAFGDFGLPEPSRAAVRAIIGLSLDKAMAILIGGEHREIPAIAARYKEIWLPMQDDPAFASQLFPGVKPVLAELSARDDLLLGIVTGKSRRGVARIVEAHRLEGMFAAVRTADDCPSKPHPAMVLECCAETGIGPAATIVIGDTAFDIGMALAAGAEGVGVSWGYHPVAELRAAGAARIVDSPQEILDVVDRPVAGVADHARVP